MLCCAPSSGVGPKATALWIVASGFFVGCACLVPLIVEWSFRRTIAHEASLSSRKTLDKFAKSSTPLHYDIYYFDVMNPLEILQGAKPLLVERGPYAYKEYFEKFDVEETSRHLHFYEQKWYIFDKERSCAGCDDLSDTVTTVDLVAVSLLEKARSSEEKIAAKTALCEGQMENAERLGSDFIGNLSPFTTKTIHEAHWGTWKDGTLKAINALSDDSRTFSPGFQTNYTSKEMSRRMCGAKDVVKTGGIRAGKSMRYVEYLGADVVRSCLSPSLPENKSLGWPAACVAQEKKWNDSEAAQHGWTLAYASRRASRVSGGEGSFVKPRAFDRAKFDGRGLFFKSPKNFFKFISNAHRFPRGSPHASLFVDSVYREISFRRTLEDGHVTRRGVNLERYQIERGEQLAASPESEYDQYETPYGVFNVTRAAGVPLYATQPHFLESDPALNARIIGTSPNRAQHNTYFDVEPRSGEVVSVRERLQFNGLLWNYDLPGLLPENIRKDSEELPAADGISRCLLSRDNWTALPDRIGGDNNTLNWQPLVLPIGYISQGYDLSDMKTLQRDLGRVDQYSRLGFLIFFQIAVLCLFRACESSRCKDRLSSLFLAGAKRCCPSSVVKYLVRPRRKNDADDSEDSDDDDYSSLDDEDEHRRSLTSPLV